METITIFYKTPSNNINLVVLDKLILNNKITSTKFTKVLGVNRDKEIIFKIPYKSIHTNKIYTDYYNYNDLEGHNNFTVALNDYFIIGAYDQIITKDEALKEGLIVYTIVNIDNIKTKNPNKNYLVITGV